VNSSGGAATQICSPQFDRRFFGLPTGTQQHIQRKIDELGCNLRGFSHQRLQGVDAFRLRVGDFRVIYQFNVEKNELILIGVGNRRDVYKTLSN
jgi:mRNA interferase RelE/StbE